jgi:hypothetical protein
MFVVTVVAANTRKTAAGLRAGKGEEPKLDHKEG